MKEIKLKSRDRTNTVLKLLPNEGSKTYLFATDATTIRVYEPNEGQIEWIDPEGGPLIRVRETLEGVGKVDKIRYKKGLGWLITFT